MIDRAERPLPRAIPRDLAGRVCRALRFERESADDLAWARSVLRPAEHAIWLRQPSYDRRHSLRVARRVETRLTETPHADACWIAAALMHDVGKTVAGLSPLARAAAVLVNRFIDLPSARRLARSRRRAFARIGLYLTHGEVGARLIRQAGGREEVAAWSEVHQGGAGSEVSGIPPEVVAALVGSDVA